jgi:hypothetical protein
MQHQWSELAAAAGAGEEIEAEGAAHEVGPEATSGGRAGALDGRGTLLLDAFGVVVNAALRWRARHQVGVKWPAILDDTRAQARMGGEDPVVDDEVLVRARD